MFFTRTCSMLFVVTVLINIAEPSVTNELSKYDEITDEYIEKINSLQKSWVAGHNFPNGTKFSDLRILLGAEIQRPPIIKRMRLSSKIKIPKSFDSRNKWPKCASISEIANQGHCSSAWAVSSAQSMSDRLCIATKGKFNIDLSAQQILSCATGKGCNSGLPFNAWKYFIEHGVVTGGVYGSKQGCQPYLIKPCIDRNIYKNEPEKCPKTEFVKTPECRTRCYNTKYHKSYKKDIHRGIKVYGLVDDVSQIQINIMKFGPAVAVFRLFSDFLTYKKGVYEHQSTNYLGGHAVRIIGWGQEDGKDYWLISNQWGTQWGDNGLVKFRRGTNEGDIESNVVSGIV